MSHVSLSDFRLYLDLIDNNTINNSLHDIKIKLITTRSFLTSSSTKIAGTDRSTKHAFSTSSSLNPKVRNQFEVFFKSVVCYRGEIKYREISVIWKECEEAVQARNTNCFW